MKINRRRKIISIIYITMGASQKYESQKVARRLGFIYHPELRKMIRVWDLEVEGRQFLGQWEEEM